MERHENPYEILGVPFDADEDVIKKAFRKAAKKYHPDRQQTDEDREKAHDIFAKYSAAYEILTDPVKRYDWKQAYAARNPQSANNPGTATPTTGKKPTYTNPHSCPQSAPARTSTAYTYKPPTSDKTTSSAAPPPPPFAQEKRKTSSSQSPKKKTSSSNGHSSWQPPPPKKQAPPPPPFQDDEKDHKHGSKKRSSRKSSSASVASSSYSFANRGKESVGRRAQEEPTGSYSVVPQLLVSGSHLKEDLRPRLRSSSIFSEQPQSNASGVATTSNKEDMRARPRSSSIFADQQSSNANGTESSFRRSSSYCPPSSTSNFHKSSNADDDRASKQQPPKRTSTIHENQSKRGRSFSPLRHAANSQNNNNKNQEEPVKSTRNIRSQSPRSGRHSTAHVEPTSPKSCRTHRKSTTIDDVPMTPPTKARSFFGLVSKSPKTNNFMKELMRDTRVDAEPYRRKKSIHQNSTTTTTSDGGGSVDSPKGRRSSIRGGGGGGDGHHVKRSKSLSGDTTSSASNNPASSSMFPSAFRFSVSQRPSEKQLDTSYSLSTQQEMDAINSPKPLRRGRRPPQ